MSMLARYKKGGGIIELVKLIEDSGEPKRSQLIAMIRQEDPEFAARVESRIFSYEMLRTLPENLLAEIVASSSPKVLAISLATETDEAFIKLCERCLGQNFSEYKSEKEVAQSSALTPSQVDPNRTIRLPVVAREAAYRQSRAWVVQVVPVRVRRTV